MKVKVDNQVYDADKMPIMLIFENDAERQMVAQHLKNMSVANDPKQIRKYCMYPDHLSRESVEDFMKVAVEPIPEIKAITE